MEGIVFIEKSAFEVDFYLEDIKLVTVINASVIFHPESADVMNNWSPEKIMALSNYIAPFIANMLPSTGNK